MQLKQRPGEILRSYANRFEKVSTNIPSTDAADERIVVISFFHGLLFGPLKEKLVLEPVKTRRELSRLVMQYIKLVEATNGEKGLAKRGQTSKKEIPKGTGTWDRLHGPVNKPIFKKPNRTFVKRDNNWVRENREYTGDFTPLRIRVGRVYAQMEERRMLPIPPKIKEPMAKRNQHKYCEYHREWGHDTDDC